MSATWCRPPLSGSTMSSWSTTLPEGSGDLIAAAFPNEQVTVLRHKENRGVGGATITGYRQRSRRDMKCSSRSTAMAEDLITARPAPADLGGEADHQGQPLYRKRDLKRMPLNPSRQFMLSG